MVAESQTRASSPPPQRAIVAVCLRYYLPGYKSGGPVRTIANLVDHLGDVFDFRIVTSDRDMHDTRPYSGVVVDGWQPVGKARVFYASPDIQTLRGMAGVVNAIDADLVYLNSFFDSRFTMLPLVARRLGMLRQRRVIVAPRGEFAASALGIKAWKKTPYRALARLSGLYSGVTWHASSDFEREDILCRMGTRAAAMTRVAVNLPKHHEADEGATWKPRQAAEPLRVVFLARIAPMKNLRYALRILASAGVRCAFAIYGMVDDERYWQQCREDIATMPEYVEVRYHGPVEPDQVGRILATHDLLILPTLGENYGHVIAESLAQGTPVLISDRTPWRDLVTRGVGWDLPLDEAGAGFVSAVKSLAAMEPAALAAMRKRALLFGRSRTDANTAKEANRRLLMSGIRDGDGSLSKWTQSP
jgi:glycosyltransferase involved in cell wall biosynthesis